MWPKQKKPVLKVQPGSYLSMCLSCLGVNSQQPTGMRMWKKLQSHPQLCLTLRSQAGSRVENALQWEVWCLVKSEMEHSGGKFWLRWGRPCSCPMPACPSLLCSPGALVGLAHTWWQGRALQGFAQAAFFPMGLKEPCWSSSELPH